MMRITNYEGELKRRDALILSNRETIKALKEENEGLYQLIDCASAYIMKIIKENGGEAKMHREEIRELVGKYRMDASVSEDGFYSLRVLKNE